MDVGDFDPRSLGLVPYLAGKEPQGFNLVSAEFATLEGAVQVRLAAETAFPGSHRFVVADARAEGRDCADDEAITKHGFEDDARVASYSIVEGAGLDEGVPVSESEVLAGAEIGDIALSPRILFDSHLDDDAVTERLIIVERKMTEFQLCETVG